MFGTDDPVKKLEKEITALTTKKVEHEAKQSEAARRRADVESKRQPLLARIAAGDDAARQDLRGLDGERQEQFENEQSHAAAVADVTVRLTSARKELARAERQVAINSAEEQITALDATSADLHASIAVVHEKAEALLTAAGHIGAALAGLDEKRFANIGPALQQRIRQATYASFLAMGKGATVPSGEFFEVVRRDLQSAVAQLRYSLADGDIKPARGEKLFVARVSCPGLRGVDLRPGDRIALRDDEAAPYLVHRSIEPLPV